MADKQEPEVYSGTCGKVWLNHVLSKIYELACSGGKKRATIGCCPRSLAISKPPSTKAKYSFPLTPHLDILMATTKVMATAKVLKVKIWFYQRIDKGRILSKIFPKIPYVHTMCIRNIVYVYILYFWKYFERYSFDRVNNQFRASLISLITPPQPPRGDH